MKNVLIAASTVLLLSLAPAIAQNNAGGGNNGQGRSDPQTEKIQPQTTQQGIGESTQGKAIQNSEDPQYQETHENKGNTIGSDADASGQMNTEGPEYQETHEDKGETTGTTN